MAGIVILRVRNCPSGTLIRLRFGEIVWPNGTVHNQFPGGDRPGGMARMLVNYTCAGANAVEQYRTQFSSFGFQFVQMEGYPGVPTADTLTAHALGPDFEVSGKFSSSHAVLNAIQRSIVASAEANWANDVPTDCPHRERRGYLGDGQHAMGTVVSNFWAIRGYVKWLRDYRDQQQLVRYRTHSFESWFCYITRPAFHSGMLVTQAHPVLTTPFPPQICECDSGEKV